MPIEKINSQLVGLPPAWLSRATGRGGAMANTTEVRKLLGEPIPQLVDPKTLAPHIAAMFRRNGLLERLQKKLALISRKKGGKFLPAKNTIMAVDEDDNVYVGVDFLEQFGDDENLIAGILAHEWGHMMSDRRSIDWSHLTFDELLALRREEEAEADGFAGRALFLMGYATPAMTGFLQRIDKKRKDKKLPCHKYHNTPTRVAILEESYAAVKRAMEMARRIFFSGSRGHTGPKIGHVIGEG